MGRASGTYVTCYVHGDKSPLSSVHHSPNIYLKFKATTSRDGNTIKVTLSDMTFKALGGYGYPMTVYAKITTASHTATSWVKLDKSTATTAVTWTRHPSNKTLSISNDTNTTVYVHIGAYSNDAKHCFSSNPTQIARYTWDVTAANYTLTYNANGGTNAPSPVTVAPNTVVPITPDVPGAQFTATYHMNPPSTNAWYPDIVEREFDSWNTKADGSGTYYKANDPDPAHSSITMTANTTLYAQWKPISYTVKPYREPLGALLRFHAQGGAVVPETNKVSFPQTGYWTWPYPSVGDNYIPGQTYSLTLTTLDLYPQYNGDQATIQDTDLPPLLTDSSISRPGYRFEGWYLDTACQNAFVTPYTTAHPDTEHGHYEPDPIDLYAKWKALPVYICTEEGGEKIWKSVEPYVWKCVEENGQKVWKQVAHIFIRDNNGWADLSQ